MFTGLNSILLCLGAAIWHDTGMVWKGRIGDLPPQEFGKFTEDLRNQRLVRCGE